MQIEGLQEDIALLERLLNQSFQEPDDFVIARMHGVSVLNNLRLAPANTPAVAPAENVLFNDVPVLMTIRWDGLNSHEEAFDKATAQLKILSGCLSQQTLSGPLSIGTIYEITKDGGCLSRRISAISWRVRPSETDYPSPTQFRRIINLSDSVDVIGNLFSMQAEKPDWFAIYKMIEAIEDHLGGENKMKSCSYLDGPELKRAKQMANSVRHIDSSKHRPPAQTMTVDDAWALIRRSTSALIAELTSA